MAQSEIPGEEETYLEWLEENVYPNPDYSALLGSDTVQTSTSVGSPLAPEAATPLAAADDETDPASE